MPDFFSESDDFLMGVEDELRLDWRWIIMAAKRSGSGWHVDPANTTLKLHQKENITSIEYENLVYEECSFEY